MFKAKGSIKIIHGHAEALSKQFERNYIVCVQCMHSSFVQEKCAVKLLCHLRKQRHSEVEETSLAYAVYELIDFCSDAQNLKSVMVD